MRIQVWSSWTLRLKERFAEGQCDIVLVTEDHVDPNGETLVTKPMGWYGAPSGAAWQRRPLPLASEPHCQFCKSMMKALDRAGLPWELAVDLESTRTVEAVVAADLAVFAQIEGTNAPQLEEISHGGPLPEMGEKLVSMSVSDMAQSTVKYPLAQLVRRSHVHRTLRLRRNDYFSCGLAAF